MAGDVTHRLRCPGLGFLEEQTRPGRSVSFAGRTGQADKAEQRAHPRHEKETESAVIEVARQGLIPKQRH